MFRRTPHISRE